jgi:hypothetical protein
MMIRRFAAALLFLAAISPAAAWAQISDADKATARQLTLDGYDALEKKDYAGAADRFARADSLYHAPTVSLGLARARVGLGKLVSAQEIYSRLVHETVPANASPAFLKAIEDARRELDALAPRVPSVVINVKGNDAPKVTLDDVEVPVAALGVKRFVDPGKHVVRAGAAGFATSEVAVTLVEGKSEAVTIELKAGQGVPPGPTPPPTKPPETTPPATTPPAAGTGTPPATAPDTGSSSGSPLKYVGITLLGVGGAGLVVGAITGGAALSQHSDLVKDCPGGHCPKGSEDMFQARVDKYKKMGTISTAGFVAGGALAATGVILMVVAPKPKPQKAAITPVLGAGYLGMQGSF